MGKVQPGFFRQTIAQPQDDAMTRHARQILAVIDHTAIVFLVDYRASISIVGRQAEVGSDTPVVLQLKAVFVGLVDIGVYAVIEGWSGVEVINFILQISAEHGQLEPVIVFDVVDSRRQDFDFRRRDEGIEGSAEVKETVNVRRLERLVVIGKQSGFPAQPIIQTHIQRTEMVRIMKRCAGSDIIVFHIFPSRP